MKTAQWRFRQRLKAIACLGPRTCINFSFSVAMRFNQVSLLWPKTLMGSVYRLGGHLADLAPAATLFTPTDARRPRRQRQAYAYSSTRC